VVPVGDTSIVAVSSKPVSKRQLASATDGSAAYSVVLGAVRPDAISYVSASLITMPDSALLLSPRP